MPKSSARFIIENARITRVHRREKVSFMTLFANTGKFEEWIDICAFDGVSDKFGEGESVTVRGDVQLAKKKEGERFRSLQLVAREMGPGKEDQTPTPRAREQRNETLSTPNADDNIPF